MAVALQAARHAGDDEGLEGAEHGRSSQARRPAAKCEPQLLGRHLAPRPLERLGDEQPLAGDALPGAAQTIGVPPGAHQTLPTVPAQTENR